MSKIITITVENESQKDQIVDVLLEAEGDGVLAFPYQVKVDDESVDSYPGSKESDCCGALISFSDICSNCKEHCDEINVEEIVSNIRRIV